jgi:uncharacterized protein
MLIRENDLRILHELFGEIHEPFEVWAFGSRVSGEAHEGSDLDLVIRTPDLKPLSMTHMIHLKEKITQSNIPILVDLLDWARIPLSFQHNIQAQYEVIFSSLGSQTA